MSIYNEFKIISDLSTLEVDENIKLFKHRNSNLQICCINNRDKHLQASILFKTPTNNNYGIPHIIEHLIFCGSKKYPYNDVLQEISKKIYHTNINAYTSNDKTGYIFSSYDLNSFKKILDIYLDSLFHPLFLENIQSFFKEGFNVKKYGGSYNSGGVVYNEMNNLFNFQEEVAQYLINRSLFPDFCESGGLPKEMPNLDFNNIIDFYRENYTIDNCTIYLYGDFDIANMLAYISVLLKDIPFKKQHNEIENELINLQICENISRIHYSNTISKKEGLNFYINFLLPQINSFSDRIINNLLKELLFASTSSYFKQKLNKLNLAKTTTLSIENDLKSSILIVGFKSVNLKKFGFKKSDLNNLLKTNIEQMLNETYNYVLSVLKEVLTKGFNQKECLIYLNNIYLNEKDSDNDGFKGFNLFNQLIKPLSDNIPLEQCIYSKKVELNLKKIPLNEIIQEKINKEIINNKQYSTIALIHGKDNSFLLTKSDLNKNKQKIHDNNLLYKKVKIELENKIIHNLFDNNSKINTKNYLKIIKQTNSVRIQNKLYFTKVKNKDISYLFMLFDVSNLTQDDFLYLDLYLKLIGKFPLDNFSHKELTKKVVKYFSELAFSLDSFSIVLNNCEIKTTKQFLQLRIKSLNKNINKALKLAFNIFLKSNFSNKSFFKRILKSAILTIEENLQDNLIVYLEKLLVASLLDDDTLKRELYFNDTPSTLLFYNKILKMNDDKNIIIKFKQVISKVINNQAGVSLATNKKDKLKKIITILDENSNKTNPNNIDDNKCIFDIDSFSLRNLLISDYETNHLVCGFKYNNKNINTGSLKIINTFIENNILFSQFREKLEIYSYWSTLSMSGYFTISVESYNDLLSLIDSINQIPKLVIEKFNKLSNDEFEDLKTAIFSELDYPVPEMNEGEDFLINEITNTSTQYQLDEKYYISSCTKTEILFNLMQIFTANINFTYFVVADEVDKKEKAFFDNIKPLIL